MKTSPLRQQLIDSLTLKGYSPRTIESYVWAVASLANHFHRSPDLLETEDVRAFLLHVHNHKSYAASTINVLINGLRYFYREVLDRPLGRVKGSLPRPRRSIRRPQAYSVEEVRRLLERGFLCTKHRTLCMTLYGAGLRLGEALHLKAEHIDSSRMFVRVVQGKGRKDRYTILPEQLLQQLRIYWLSHRPRPWLFPSRHHPDQPVSAASVQKTFIRALERAGLPRKGGPHTLRHSFATHLIENGTPLHVIKRFLGHNSATTTAGYLHITRHTLKSVVSPLDTLNLATPETALG
jgi:site-specific recombinase XerD